MPTNRPGPPLVSDIDRLTALYNAGKFAELAQEATALLQLHPETGQVWKLLGIAQRRMGQNAVAAFEHASRLLPTDAEVFNAIGNALRDANEAGNLERAEEAYRRALQLHPDFAM